MIKLADTLAPMSNDFYAVESENVGIDIDGTSKSIQQAYEDGDLSSGGSSIQVDTMPIASAENENMIVEFIGSTGTYVNGYFYECVSDGESTPTYSWVQKNVQPSNATATDVSYDNTTSELIATNVQDAIDEIKGGLGTASGKNFTDLVRPNSHELVESGSVYSAINNALSSIYTPRGELTCAELTSSLLIEDNVGNIYTMSDSGTTSALFINGAGLTINIGDNVGIIKAGADTYLFNYMGNAFDLTDYQKKDLSSPIAGASTVEGAIAQNTSDIEKIKAYTAVSNTDANTLTTTGLYYLTTGCTNIPSAYCILQVQSKNTTSISDDIAQYTVNTEGEQYYRVRVNGTWSSWKKLATEDNSVKILSSDTFTDMNALLADLKTRGTGFYKGKAYLSSTALWHDYDICINIGIEGYWYGIGNLRSEAGAEYYVYKTYSLSDSWTIQKLTTTENLTNITLSDYQLSVGGDNYAWFDLGTSTSTSNSQAFLFYEITYGRVDGGQSKILVSCSGTMADLNYIKAVNLNDTQTSATEQLRLDNNKHIWLGMQSYCYAHVKVYGRWTGMGIKTTVEPTGIVLPIYKLVTENEIKVFKTAQSDSLLWYAQQKFGCVAGTRYRVQLTLSSSHGAWMGVYAFNAVSQAGTFNNVTTTFVKCGGTIDIQGITEYGTLLHDGGFVCAMAQMIDPM